MSEWNTENNDNTGWTQHDDVGDQEDNCDRGWGLVGSQETPSGIGLQEKEQTDESSTKKTEGKINKKKKKTNHEPAWDALLTALLLITAVHWARQWSRIQKMNSANT